MARQPKRDLIVLCIVGTLAVLYFLGTPADVLVNLLMVGLLLAAIAYVIIHSFLDGFKEFRSIQELRKIKRLKQSVDDIDTMSWQEFEVFVANWMKNQGFDDVHLTEHYDLGADIVAKKNGKTWGVQVKHYHSLVKADAIRQIVVALKHYKCDRGMVVTNSYFSRPATQLAKSNDCVLIDGPGLRAVKRL